MDRDELLAAVEARVDAEEEWAEQDPPPSGERPILAAEALAEARHLAAAMAADDLDARYILGWFHAHRYSVLPDGEEAEDFDTAMEMFAVCFIAEVEGLPQGMLTPIAWQAHHTALAMLGQAMASADPEPADQVVALWRRIVAATPEDDPSGSMFRNNLGVALQNRFNRRGERADLDAAVETHRAAVAAMLPDASEPAMILSNLGNVLQLRFVHGGSLDDLTGAIEANQAAASLSGSNPGMYLNNLGVALQNRFERLDTRPDLDAAIDAFQAALAVPATPFSDHPGTRSNLGSALRARFDRTGSPQDLDTAIETLRASVAATPTDHPKLGLRLNNLGISLQSRFKLAGAPTDLNEAVETLKAAVAATPPGHPNRGMHLSNLGNVLQNRFERTAGAADLEAAIEALYGAVAALPAGHPNLSPCLNNLAVALRSRFDRDGALADLDAAIDACRAAVAAIPAGQPTPPGMPLTTLGSLLLTRFNRAGAPADLDASVEAQESAVASLPADHPARIRCLNNLGTALYNRFLLSDTVDDLDAAIEAFRSAVAAVAPNSRDWLGCLDNLGTALRTRFMRARLRSDLDAAIDAHRQVVAAVGTDRPDRAKRLLSLGTTLRTRFEDSHAQGDRDAALSVLVQAAEYESAPPSVRIRAAREAATLAAPASAAALLEAAVLLLPEVAPRQLDRSDQQDALGGFAGLAADAAALALAAGTGEGGARRALRLLEAGRAVLLGQALDSRGDLTELRRLAPELAARFTDLRERLDESPTTTIENLGWQDRRTVGRTLLAEEFTQTLAQIRNLPGLGSFARPPAFEDLLEQARPGPIVTYNVSTYRSDALVLTTDGVAAIPLPGLAHDTLIEQITGFYLSLQSATSPHVSTTERAAAQRQLRTTLEWLWNAAAEPVLLFLGHTTAPPPDADWPRVWWVTGGLLGLLPLHAAGHHTDPPGPQRRTVLDRVVSSHTPTIRALRHARTPRPDAADRAFIVAMPTTPGLADDGVLPNVPAEVALLRAHMPGAEVLIDSADGDDALPTKANVLARLPHAAIAHFACHGAIDPANPSGSRLLLSDHETDPFTIAGLAPVNLDRARLAYLSACSTALSGGAGLADEAIHLAAAFQLAGFPHVIGTLWEIDDEIAVAIADTFYSHLRDTGPHLDTALAARALHEAVRTARDTYPRAPSLWAAHLHSGA